MLHPAQNVAESVVPTLAAPDSSSSIDARWNAVVAATPDALAIASSGTSLTFAETDAAATALARQLVAALPAGDEPVGVMAGQRTDAVVAIFALIKAARVYVFLDPHMPAARLAQVAELAGITHIVADDEHLDQARTVAGEARVVHRLDGFLTADDDPTVELPAVGTRHGADAFTLVFTSGSTGAPKGVISSHAMYLNEARSFHREMGLGEGDRLGVVMPVGFAAGAVVLTAALLNGASAWIADATELGVEGTLDWIAESALTVMISTPHLVRGMTAATEPTDTRLHSLRAYCTVGEANSGDTVRGLHARMAEGASYWNITASSEMGSVAWYELVVGAVVPDGNIPAGRIIESKDLVLVDDTGVEVPTGTVGKVVAISEYMSPGYWKNPERHAEVFGVRPDGRHQVTQGDLGRFDEHGILSFVGRSDAAVKVRGYLVEPSEIEAALMAMELIRDAVVIAVVAPPMPTRLVAYVVAAPTRRQPSPAAIRLALRDVLPEYMVPSSVVLLPELPRNERGKVERRELPSAPLPGERRVDAPEENFDQWQLVVGQIWAEVLGVEAVGLDDDFSELGGDSLTAEAMLATVQERLGIDLPSTQILENPTLRLFAARVRAGARSLPGHDDIVKLTHGNAGTPVFAIAGAGALAFTFVALARRLEGHDVYGFQQHGLEHRAIPDWSLEKMARRYIALMRVVQPHGPYYLLGHSLGGIVALEMARILREAGEQVGHIVILDTYLPRSTKELGEIEFGKIAVPEEDRRSAVVKARLLGEKVLRRFLPGGLPKVERVTRRLRGFAGGMVVFEGQKHFDALFDQAMTIMRRHTVVPYDGRVTYIRANGNPDGPAEWQDVLVGETEYLVMASEHTSLLREPHVAELAAAVNHVLPTEPQKRR